MNKIDFSRQSKAYAQFRPDYPEELYDFLLSHVPARGRAWDCGTGSGQVARVLAGHFERVFATDISENQIRNAFQANNIEYRIEPAEKTSFPDEEFDLITVAQAAHWFDFPRFYDEARRVLKPNGIIVLFGYSLCRVTDGIDRIVRHFYRPLLDPYWDERRRHIDEEYRSIPFLFPELTAPGFVARFEWDVERFFGFLQTWSAVQNYIDDKGQSPVTIIENDVRKEWGTRTRTVEFPIFARIGKKR